MNEGIAVFLKLDLSRPFENEALIRRIDALLLEHGMRYSGIWNMYEPMNERARDHAVFAADEALRNAPWLKGIFDRALVANRVSVCAMEDILTDYMSTPSEQKLKYYEEYYCLSGELAHPVVVDERGQMRDGYTSYLIAQKYGFKPDIYEAFSEQPLKKAVCGYHVRYSGGKWSIARTRGYWWFYNLKDPVVPGDVLQVWTRKGLKFVEVEEIRNVTGREFCRKFSEVRRHTGMRMEQK